MVTANTAPLTGYHGGEYGHGKYHTFSRLSRRRVWSRQIPHLKQAITEASMVTANTAPLAGYHGGEYGHGKYHTFNRLSRRRVWSRQIPHL